MHFNVYSFFLQDLFILFEGKAPKRERGKTLRLGTCQKPKRGKGKWRLGGDSRLNVKRKPMLLGRQSATKAVTVILFSLPS